MAHIPPGIDAYATFANTATSAPARIPRCSSPTTPSPPPSPASPTPSASSSSATPTWTSSAPFNQPQRHHPSGTIPAKLVPSITPVNGNNPAFTLAAIEPSTATLQDYTVFSADNKTGIDTRWSEEYRFSTTYHLPDLSGPSLAKLTAAFVSDKSGTSAASQAYQQFFYVGDLAAAHGLGSAAKAAAMQIVWPFYACAITHADTPGFRTCACPTQPTP